MTGEGPQAGGDEGRGAISLGNQGVEVLLVISQDFKVETETKEGPPDQIKQIKSPGMSGRGSNHCRVHQCQGKRNRKDPGRLQDPEHGESKGRSPKGVEARITLPQTHS